MRCACQPPPFTNSEKYILLFDRDNTPIALYRNPTGDLIIFTQFDRGEINTRSQWFFSYIQLYSSPPDGCIAKDFTIKRAISAFGSRAVRGEKINLNYLIALSL